MSATELPKVAMVGRKQAAEILGVSRNHTHKMQEAGAFPPSLQDRGLDIDTSTPLWTRAEIEALRDRRAAK